MLRKMLADQQEKTTKEEKSRARERGRERERDYLNISYFAYTCRQNKIDFGEGKSDH